MSETIHTGKLKCTAGRGMFPHEASILIQGAEQCYESMVDRDLLTAAAGDLTDGENIQAFVCVGVVKVNGTKMLVELPRQVVAGGRRIWVPKTEVQT